MQRKSADIKRNVKTWKNLGGRGGAEGKYTRMARKRRPAGNAFEYMYLYKMFWCQLYKVAVIMVIETHHWMSASMASSSVGLRMADGSG